MSTATPQPSAQRHLPDLATVEVRSWLMRDRPIMAAIAFALFVGVVVLIYTVSGSWLGASAGSVALVVAMRRFWLPITFRLDAYGITREVSGRRRRIAWSLIARYEVCHHGVVLFPRGADYRLAAGQGLFIPWGDQREEVMAMLADHVSVE